MSEQYRDRVCGNEQRRYQTRQARLNGIDYLEVEISPDGVVLTVLFLGKLKRSIEKENVLILGGQRIRNLQVLGVTACLVEGIEQDDCLKVYLDRAGDFSTYTLCLVEVDEYKHPLKEDDWQEKPRYKPLLGFDPRYACLDFTFQAACPSDLDCKSEKICPPEKPVEPEINYLAKDYASFRQLILDRLALLAPDWQERHVPDLGITLVELLAYTGDYLSYFQDAVATEAYLDTARKRISVRRHARLVDYYLFEGSNARAWEFVRVDRPTGPLKLEDFFFIAPYNNDIRAHGMLKFEELANAFPAGYEVFEPLPVDGQTSVSFSPGHNQLYFYTWGDRECCLPRGTTTATLRGPIKPELKKGDFLLFEEVLGPKTGAPADADPRHRHVVRLTEVRKDVDPLILREVVEIAWDPADALPFPLCLSTIGNPPNCEYLCDITVARGNLVLVDHGRRVEEDLDPVPSEKTVWECEDVGRPRISRVHRPRYRPALTDVPLVFSQRLPRHAPAASRLLVQQDRYTQPAILQLADSEACLWEVRRDLLSSGSEQRHFVAEIDDDRRARLRFGDGELGRAPSPGSKFHIVYRIGGGLAGNVGAEKISQIVFRPGWRIFGVNFSPRNPFPATGGKPPESTTHARLMAPYAFHSELQRAVIPDDYAVLVQRDFPDLVQRAAATLRWTGSWYEVLVAPDLLGGVEASSELCEIVRRRLRRYRRIGHDLVVKPAQFVALDLALIVCVLPDALRGHVKRAVLQALSSGLRPDGQPGFFHPDLMSFGEPVLLSRILATVQGVEGVESVTVTRFKRQFAEANHEIEDGYLQVGPLEIARLDNDPSFPENGKLELTLRGGR